MSSVEKSGFRCALVGADSLLMECGDLLRSKGNEIVVVGAGSPKVQRWATANGIASFDASGPASLWAHHLAADPIEWLFAITHLSILPDQVLAIASSGSVNFHDGPLPAYAGLNTPAWALLRGEETYGVTWHAITAGIDEGNILEQQIFDIAPGETSLSLNTRNFATAIESFESLIELIADGAVTPTPQDPAAPRTTFSRHDRPEAMAFLDWDAPAEHLERMVRALTFGPYPNPLGFAKVRVDGQVLLVTQAAVAAEASGAPGTVVEVADDRVVVATGAGGLALVALADQTGRPVAPGALGWSVGSVVDVLDEPQRAELSRIGALLARAEHRHLRNLESLEPVEVSWARTPTADHVARFGSLDVDVPAPLHDRPDAVATSFLLLLGRLSGKDRFHVAVVDDRARHDLDHAAGLLAPATPLEVTVHADEDLDSATVRLGADLQANRTGVPFARELIARHPDLVAVPELAAGRSLSVAVRFGVPGDPHDGVVVELHADADGSSWTIRYDDGLVDPGDAAVLASCLGALLADLASDPTRPVARVDLLGPDLRAQVLETWNDTETPAPSGVAIHQLVELQVDATPDVDAVVFEDRPCTYRTLDERANRLAHHLIGLGVGPGHLVGVHVNRGIDLLVTVLAVHKAGGAYVPLDPVYPHDRLGHMIRDCGCRVIVTEASVIDTLPERDDPAITVVTVDADRSAIDAHPSTRPNIELPDDALAYCIYTSGSTGLPKGVLVEHRNAVNFFVGMDDRVAHELPATWFAVTSLSFDISVLELLYTLTRGFTVVVYLDRDRVADSPDDTFVERHPDRPIGFSLFYFSGDAAEGHGSQKYRLLMEGARFADEHGFEAVWTPERHFHAFGGLYPQPAITGAAVAAITKNVAIRAGSVVMPLHHPIRVAEAWSIVDNLSDGRVGISVASGWQPNDFVLMPQNYTRAKDLMFEGLEEVKRLWRGETVSFPGATDEPVSVRTLPRPVQPELPAWITSAGNPETYIQAGRIGANVLTHLLGQSVEQLAPKIEAYRNARAEAGFDPDEGQVTLMLHTFVGDDDDAVRELVREPLKEYLGTSFSLLKEYAWSFPAFQRPDADDDDGLVDEDFKNLSEDDLDAVLEFAFLRYYETSGLFGSPDRCRRMVDQLKGIGVDEIACLVDFGVGTDIVLDSLPALDRVRQASNPHAEAEPSTGDQSVSAQLARHRVTHLQCTPSMARMLSMQDDSRDALAGVEHLFVGGEAFPTALARDLMAASRSGKVTNMYGPTETTIWSTTWPLHGDLATIPIGAPIANTRIYILDRHREPLPPGVAGDLWIGGDGVVRGYHERPELTAERFVPDPFRGDGHRMYLTGDLARWVPDGQGSASIEFLGRADHQVKIRGYRIELGEIEAQLGRFPGVLECVAVVREDTPGDQQLVGYLSTTAGETPDPAKVKDHLRQTLPEVMVPGHIVVLDDLPHTPNGKIDRNGLPSLAEVLGARVRAEAPVEAGNDLERQVLDVWTEILGRTDIGVNDNFFDIGGHSLLAVRLHRRLRTDLDRTFPLTDVYRHPTVRSFAEAMSTDTFAAVIEDSKGRAARRRESLDRRRARR